MKKIIAIISALAIAASMTACGAENTAPETTEATAAAIAETTVAETTTASEAETEAAEEGAPKAEDDTVESIDEVFANRADGLWMIDLSNKARQWPNNVKVTMSYEMEGIVTNMTMEVLGDKYFSNVEVADMLSSTQIFDGTNTYIVDNEAKNYCIDPVNAGGIDAYLIAEEDMDSFTDAGIEEINGTKYIYEEYDIMGIPTRYYFDEFGNVVFYAIDMDGIKTIMNYTIEFADEADESVFAPPADYAEITYEDYKSQFME